MNWELFWMCFIAGFAASLVGILVYAIISAERATRHKQRLEEMRVAHEHEKELRGNYGQ